MKRKELKMELVAIAQRNYYEKQRQKHEEKLAFQNGVLAGVLTVVLIGTLALANMVGVYV